MSAYSFARACGLGVVMLCAACGGGDGGGEVRIGGGGDDGVIYLNVQIKTAGGIVSDRSNEISGTVSEGVVISWMDPTRTVLGSCLSQSEIVSYVANVGAASGVYSESYEVSKIDDTGLTCAATSEVDSDCGSIYRCEYEFQANLSG